MTFTIIRVSFCLYTYDRPIARLFCGGGGGQIGQILEPIIIMCGLSCDRVGFGHFGAGQMTPLTPHLPQLWACMIYIYTYDVLIIDE